jgi:hypothetical protein
MPTPPLLAPLALLAVVAPVAASLGRDIGPRQRGEEAAEQPGKGLAAGGGATEGLHKTVKLCRIHRSSLLISPHDTSLAGASAAASYAPQGAVPT